MFSKASFLFCNLLFCCSLLIATPSISIGQQTQFLQHLWEVDPPLGNIWDIEQISRTIRFDVESLQSAYAKDRTVESRPISTGARIDDEMVVERGLEAGETVVTEGHLRLAPGTRIQLRDNRGAPGKKARPAS